MATYIEQSLAKLKEFEGCIPWMYRDTVGKVTVGVGLMVPDANAAHALPFVLATRPATPAEIAAEYTRVDTMPLGQASAFYKPPTALELTQQTIDAKLTSVLEGFEADLRTQLPHYDTLPDSVKMALLDMIYNLGPAGLFKGFPHLIAAVDAGAWVQAAERCIRRGPAQPATHGHVSSSWTPSSPHQGRNRDLAEANLGSHTSNLNVLFGRRP